jgi:DNA primase
MSSENWKKVRSPKRSNPVPADVLQAIKDLGEIPEKVTDDEAYVLCPWHDDHHAGSFSINLETGGNFCFSCHTGGSFLDYVQEVTGESYLSARRWIMNQGIRLLIEPNEEVRLPEVISEQALSMFTTPPLSELTARSISSYAAQEYGVLWETRTASWICPIRNPKNNKLWGWQRKHKADVENYPKTVRKSKTLFGVERFDHEIGVLVESPLDCPRLFSGVGNQYGYVASYGAAVSLDQMALMLQLSDTWILWMDNDEAGKTNTFRILDVMEKRMKIRLAMPQSGYKDPGDMDDADCLRMLQNAQPSFTVRTL